MVLSVNRAWFVYLVVELYSFMVKLEELLRYRYADFECSISVKKMC